MMFEDFYTHYYPSIQGYLYSRLKNYELAEDEAQEIMLKAYKAFDSMLPGQESKWIYTIAKRHCIDVARHHNLVGFVEIQEWYAQADMPDLGMQEQIAATWRAMNDLYHMPLSLYYEQDYSTKAIARRMGTTQGAIQARLMRGRREFQALYQALEVAS